MGSISANLSGELTTSGSTVKHAPVHKTPPTLNSPATTTPSPGSGSKTPSVTIKPSPKTASVTLASPSSMKMIVSTSMNSNVVSPKFETKTPTMSKNKLEPPSIEVHPPSRCKVKRVHFADPVEQRRPSKIDDGKIAAPRTTTGPSSIDPYAPVHSGGSASISLKTKPVSLAGQLHQNIVSVGELRRVDKLITFCFMFFTCVYLFLGSGVSWAIDGHSPEKPITWKCKCENPVVLINCTARTTVNESDGITTGQLTTTYDNSTASTTNNATRIECWIDRSNESWTIWNDCLIREYYRRVPFSFVRALFYTFSVVTTIGYGNVVAEGRFAQGVLVVYSIIAIPMFFEFVAFISELIRNMMAIVYDRYVVRRFLAQRAKPDEAKKRESSVVVILRAYPDGLPFTILFLLVAIYLFAFAGVLTAVGMFERSYKFAFYYIMQSVTLVGLGDEMPERVSFNLAASPFIILGIIFVGLIHAVMEEWITKPFELLVNYFTLEESRVDKPFAEQTLEDLMKLRPGEEDWPEASAEPQPLRPVRKAIKVEAGTPAETPTPLSPISPPPASKSLRSDRGSISSQRSRRSSSLHLRPFRVGRYSLREMLDDNEEMDMFDE